MSRNKYHLSSPFVVRDARKHNFPFSAPVSLPFSPVQNTKVFPGIHTGVCLVLVHCFDVIYRYPYTDSPSPTAYTAQKYLKPSAKDIFMTFCVRLPNTHTLLLTVRL